MTGTPPTRYPSPLRYPGGKGRLAPFLFQVLQANRLTHVEYVEPFAGGAGAALRLLYDGAVERIVLNDADPCICAFWRAILKDGSQFLRTLRSTPVTIGEWFQQREVYRNRASHSDFELGFATFYLNRCNRSGILRNGSAVGGLAQNGGWGIDCRFDKKRLATRIERIWKERSRIEISNLDALDFLRSYLGGVDPRKCFIYLDPPYFEKGSALYLNYYEADDHKRLAFFLRGLQVVRWVLTYDNAEAIWDLYSRMRILPFRLRYSVQGRREGRELLIAPAQTTLPGDRAWKNITVECGDTAFRER